MFLDIMPNLTLDDGRVIEDIKLILSEQKEYYKNLYSSKQMENSQDNLEIFFDNDNPFLTKLTEDKMVACSWISIQKNLQNSLVIPSKQGDFPLLMFFNTIRHSGRVNSPSNKKNITKTYIPVNKWRIVKII
jgi:hypothetical protein